MNEKGRSGARLMLMGCVVRAARDLRDATRLLEDIEAREVWIGLDEALTALDDFSAMKTKK